MEADGTRRVGTLSDYENAARLVHSYPAADLSGIKYLVPGDVPAEGSHLNMLKINMSLNYKPSLRQHRQPENCG